jgi:hypothetical protein
MARERASGKQNKVTDGGTKRSAPPSAGYGISPQQKRLDFRGAFFVAIFEKGGTHYGGLSCRENPRFHHHVEPSLTE